MDGNFLSQPPFAASLNVNFYLISLLISKTEVLLALHILSTHFVWQLSIEKQNQKNIAFQAFFISSCDKRTAATPTAEIFMVMEKSKKKKNTKSKLVFCLKTNTSISKK